MKHLVAVSVLACTLAFAPWAARGAHAQTVGTFSWQLQPYCNVVTATVTQSGGVFTIDGTDDLCGANPRASVTGLAFQNPNGTVSFGLSLVVPPAPTPIHLTATIDLGSLGGTWKDSAGNTGPFVFSPASISGSPRPAATPVFTAGLSAGGNTVSNVGAPAASTDAANRGYVDSAVDGRHRADQHFLSTDPTPVHEILLVRCMSFRRPPQERTSCRSARRRRWR